METIDASGTSGFLKMRHESANATSITKAPLRKGAELPNPVKLNPAHVGPPMRANADAELTIESVFPCCSATARHELRLLTVV